MIFRQPPQQRWGGGVDARTCPLSPAWREGVCPVMLRSPTGGGTGDSPCLLPVKSSRSSGFQPKAVAPFAETSEIGLGADVSQ